MLENDLTTFLYIEVIGQVTKKRKRRKEGNMLHLDERQNVRYKGVRMIKERDIKIEREREREK